MKHIRIGVALLGLCLCISIGATGQTEIVLNSDKSSNDSLVNVAYGSVNNKDLSNAISILKPSEYLDKHYGTYPLDGTAAFIGGNNLWGLGSALVLIDGVPRSIENITANEIDQISFLKGANAVVLYGSRAANGVILITSKRGVKGEQKSNVFVNTGINTPKMYPNYLGSAEYMTFYNKALSNDGLNALYSDKTIEDYASRSNLFRYPDVDYYSTDYLRKMYNSHSASVDFSGGNERARFYAVAGVESQNSLLNIGEGKNENNLRLNLRGNIDLDLNDYVSTYVSISTIFYDSKTANGNFWNQASSLQPHRFSPLIPIDLIKSNSDSSLLYIENSKHIIDGKYLLGGSQENLTNPIADAYADGQSTFTSRQFQYSSGVDIDLVNVLKGLSFHGQVGIDYSNRYRQYTDNNYAVYVPTWVTAEGTDSISALTKFNKDSNDGKQNLDGTYNYQVFDFNVHFDYKNTFNTNHNVTAMLLAAGFMGRQTGDFQYRTNANLGLQATYNFAHKYYADFSSALVTSTKLAPGNRLAFSPTISLGWVLSEEEFLKGSDAINRLKLSASAGIVNTDLDIANYYLYNENYSSTAYFSWYDAYYVNQATTISRSENKDLTFAKRKEVNFGVEGSFLDNKIDVQATVFSIKKDGIPVQRYTLYPSFYRTYWPETSFVPYSNYEANSYNGADIQLVFNEKAGDVNLKFGFAATYVSSNALVREELYEDTYRNRAGKPTDAIFGLESEGLFMSQDDINSHAAQKFGEVKPGDIKYKDQNNDNIIDERDEVLIGRWGSPLTGGVHFTANYKGFTLFALGTAQFGGNGIKNGSYYWVYGNRKYSEVVRNSWTEETKETATYPRLTTLSGDNNFRYSDFWIYSTNRFNISKIQLTYSIPTNALENSFVKGLNVYVSGANLLTISKNKDIMELNVGSTPQTRFYNLGIKAVF